MRSHFLAGMQVIEPLFKFVNRQGLVKIEALCEITLALQKQLDLRFGFHALYEAFQTKILRHRDYMP